MKWKSLVGTLVLLLKATKQQEQGRSLNEDLEEAEGSLHTFDFFGDCIGLAPGMGKPGNYIQSDLQFIQKVQEEIREFLGEGPVTRIPDTFNMNIQARFFVNDQHKASNVMTASELFVDYSDAFKKYLDNENIDYYIDDWFKEMDEMTDEEFENFEEEDWVPPIVDEFEDWENSVVYPLARSQYHGYQFQNMFKPPIITDLSGKIVTEYLFDDDGHFAGFVIEDVESG